VYRCKSCHYEVKVVAEPDGSMSLSLFST
jgi:hypothetical protein